MAVSKGDYYRRKTKKMFDEDGYHTEYMEVKIRVWDDSKKALVYRKTDILECDGVSMNGEEIIFWNSVLGRAGISSHYKRFKKLPFPKSSKIKVYIIVWTKGAREPEIVEVM